MNLKAVVLVLIIALAADVITGFSSTTTGGSAGCSTTNLSVCPFGGHVRFTLEFPLNVTLGNPTGGCGGVNAYASICAGKSMNLFFGQAAVGKTIYIWFATGGSAQSCPANTCFLELYNLVAQWSAFKLDIGGALTVAQGDPEGVTPIFSHTITSQVNNGLFATSENNGDTAGHSISGFLVVSIY
jgi:hypothetical protein